MQKRKAISNATEKAIFQCKREWQFLMKKRKAISNAKEKGNFQWKRKSHFPMQKRKTISNAKKKGNFQCKRERQFPMQRKEVISYTKKKGNFHCKRERQFPMQRRKPFSNAKERGIISIQNSLTAYSQCYKTFSVLNKFVWTKMRLNRSFSEDFLTSLKLWKRSRRALDGSDHFYEFWTFPQSILNIFAYFRKEERKRYRGTDQRTDTPSYIHAWRHRKI